MSQRVERNALPRQESMAHKLPVPYKTASSQEREKIFHVAVALFDFAQTAERFKLPTNPRRHCGRRQVERPPPDADLRSETRIGEGLAVFYHSTYPSPVQHIAPLQWSSYIGFSGHSEGSIMLEAERAARGVS
ncbi:hypothetical protein C8F01DRAFT_1257155 [Mycena amicta]|nr:hypothetical protein C8F01DRAFT_1257155 [Mycena amicta]